MRARCDQTFVMGLSMGGTLVTRLAEQRGDDIAGVVVVNGVAVHHPQGRQAAAAAAPRRAVAARRSATTSRSRASTEPAYDRLPVKAAWQLSKLWALTNADLARITAPLLVMTSRDDHVVETANSERLMSGAGSADKRQVWLEDSFHVATLDNDLPVIIKESLAFIEAHHVVLTLGG